MNSQDSQAKKPDEIKTFWKGVWLAYILMFFAESQGLQFNPNFTNTFTSKSRWSSGGYTVNDILYADHKDFDDKKVLR